MASTNPISRFTNLELGSQPVTHNQEESQNSDESIHFEEASRLFDEGLFEPALRSFAKVLEFNPQNTTAWTRQVQMLIELEEFHEAKLWADKAIERFPRCPELLATKAVALARQGDLAAALAFSDACFEERGQGAYLWLARADVMLARKEKRADYCFEKATTLASSDWRTHWQASRIFFYYRKFTLALKSVQTALNITPTNGILWCQAGRCQLELGMNALAQSSFEHAVDLNPRCDDARTALTQLKSTNCFTKLRGLWNRITSR